MANAQSGYAGAVMKALILKAGRNSSKDTGQRRNGYNSCDCMLDENPVPSQPARGRDETAGESCTLRKTERRVYPLSLSEEYSLMKPGFTAMDFFEAKVNALVAKHPDIPGDRKTEAARNVLRAFNEQISHKPVEMLVAQEASPGRRAAAAPPSYHISLDGKPDSGPQESCLGMNCDGPAGPLNRGLCGDLPPASTAGQPAVRPAYEKCSGSITVNIPPG